ncbi:tRNA (adenosine(37)-N6)-dimethylallyltransferase MiaA [Candidatus Woesebacteria bacterium]|nr:tRNA (adenosine(37)-N6)-dimethylallyltransferase MiaA [Candidatus Woesebacteria bacterium]
MNKILVIVGPTAVGKTALALALAKKFDGELLSADSRQVYKGMDIVTGKDLPKDGTKIWLTDLVDPKEEFSVSQWRKEAMKVLKSVWDKKRLPIVVGGTGLYIRALLDGIGTIDIPPNKSLRDHLSGKTPQELFDILASVDNLRAAGMNQSDRKNPRRLLRAIEISHWEQDKSKGRDKGNNQWDIFMIGLKTDELGKSIEKRVKGLVEEGALDEVKRLIKGGTHWDAQSMTGIGYRKFRDFFDGKISLEEVERQWVQADLQYAKRQMTWFKKDKRVKWFDVARSGWQKKVEKAVKNWYN